MRKLCLSNNFIGDHPALGAGFREFVGKQVSGLAGGKRRGTLLTLYLAQMKLVRVALVACGLGVTGARAICGGSSGHRLLRPPLCVFCRSSSSERRLLRPFCLLLCGNLPGPDRIN